MLRAALALLACLMLGACSGWVSDERLFGDGDWAHLDINGRYSDPTREGQQVIFKTLPNGLIEGRNPNKAKEKRSLLGLVSIKGGSDEYFLSVVRTEDSADGDQYFIAHVSNDKELTFYAPDCAATSPVAGMTKVPAPFLQEETEAVEATLEEPGSATADQAIPAEPADDAIADEAPASPGPNAKLVCKFSTKDALMAAGLEAETFLSAPHIVTIFGITYSPVQDSAQEEQPKRATRRPPPRRSRQSPAGPKRRR